MGHNYAIVLAGGKGSRMGSSIPKQYMEIDGRPMLYYSIAAFESCAFIDEIILVTVGTDIEYCREEIVRRYGFSKVTKIVSGGSTRYASVYCGLQAVNDRNGYVFIHDGARPCINDELLDRLYTDVKKYNAAVAAVRSKDTVKISGNDKFVMNTPLRDNVWNVQTPQVFAADEICSAYENMMQLFLNDDALSEEAASGEITDDAMVMERFGSGKVYLTESFYGNIKVTTAEDLYTVENILKKTKKNKNNKNNY